MKLNELYKANVMFEGSIDLNGNNYLVIYGEHINGYYICIPNWGIACEACESSDEFYNMEKMMHAGIYEKDARALARAIKQIARQLRRAGK